MARSTYCLCQARCRIYLEPTFANGCKWPIAYFAMHETCHGMATEIRTIIRARANKGL
jgi:hypothetical protein